MKETLLYTGNQALEAAGASEWAAKEALPYFQSLAFLKLWRDMPAFEPCLIHCREADKILGSFCGVLMRNPLHPLRFASRFIAWGNPIVLNGEDPLSITSAILNHLKSSLPKGLVYAEIRELIPSPGLSPAYAQAGFSFLPYTGLRIDLKKGDPLSRIRSSRLRQAKQASSAGVEVRPARNADEVMAWYRLMRRKYWQIRKPLPPLAFYLHFFQDGTEKNTRNILLAIHKDEIIGGLMLAGDPHNGLYLWYVGGERKAGKASSPMALLYTEVIRESQAAGAPFLDLMGGGLQGKPSGRNAFKMSFSPDVSLPGRYILIRRPLIYALAARWVKA
jgi:hypothetical protein